MKYIKYIFLAILAAVSCQKLDYPEADTANTISTLKCFVYYDETNLRLYQEVNLLSQNYNEKMGAVTYTFPDDPERFNAESLKRCRLEAAIPSTARLVEIDATGKELGTGIGGMRDFSV
ncbi:MAG: hypothetical protein IJ005_00680, partial [Bacteroidales bacterium]|nr:hypothetical protein [Bacteroidales bacterium]